MEKRWLTRLAGYLLTASLFVGCSNSAPAPVEPDPLPAIPPPDMIPGPPVGVPQPWSPQSESASNEHTADDLKRACLTPEQLEQGWVRMFDGHSLFGWFYVGNADWTPRNQCIEVNSGETSYLCTSIQLADYELVVEFNCPTSTDSGICLRAVADPQDLAHDCLEMNIAPPSDSFPTGSLSKRKAVESPLATSAEKWHTCRMLVEKQQVKVWLDDQLVTDYTDADQPRRGYISLQYKAGPVRFRNILMRPIGLQPILTGDDWSADWTKVEAGDSKLEVASEEGTLRLRGGPGELQTKNQWQNFVMQATYKLANPNVDTGILFRCSPGAIDQGYECQLHHALTPTAKPISGGPGSIIRSNRAAENVARVVIGDGTEPTYVTVLAEDSQLATWINGVLISDGADTRDPDENARLGSKRTAGPIGLQGKDPSTDVEFSRVMIAPIP